MEFLTWWFEDHWFWSTLLTPWFTFAWACWKGLLWRGVVAFIIAAGYSFNSSS